MEKENNNKLREMTNVEKIQLSLSFASPVLVFLFFIIAFVFIVKFDKNSFYPTYNIIKEHHALFLKLDLKYEGKIENINEIDSLKSKSSYIKNNSEYYNLHVGFLKNKSMIDLTNIYHDYNIKLEEINRFSRHQKYLSKMEYEDIVELLPTETEMQKINDSLPKPFFSTFIKAIFIALISQFLLYNFIVQPLKLISRINKKNNTI